jgi:hypothetical protein
MMSRAAQTHLAGRVFETPVLGNGARWPPAGPGFGELELGHAILNKLGKFLLISTSPDRKKRTLMFFGIKSTSILGNGTVFFLLLRREIWL